MTAAAPRRFAEGTEVEVSSSQEQIKRLVMRHGATQFLLAEGLGEDGQLRALLQFHIRGRMLKYSREYPAPKEAPRGMGGWRNPTEQQRAQLHRWRQSEWKRRWRALHLIIKAKLELVASGDVEFDREFLADIMLPDGTTVGASAVPAVADAYESGKMPRLLPGNAES